MCTAAEAKYDRFIGASGRQWLIAKTGAHDISSPLVADTTGRAGIEIDGQRYWLSNYSDAFGDTLIEVCRERAEVEHLCAMNTDLQFTKCPACNIGAPGASPSKANILDKRLSFVS